MIDLLAYYYNWSKKSILEEVYPDEVMVYLNRIQVRLLDRQIEKENISLSNLMIAHNPYTKNPKRLHSELQRRISFLKLKRDSISEGGAKEEIDKAGIRRIKRKLNKSGKFVKAK